MKPTYFLAGVLSLLLFFSFSCNRKKGPDISGIQVNLTLHRLDQEFEQALSTGDPRQNVNGLFKKYPDFFENYLYSCLEFPYISDTNFVPLAHDFYNDPGIQLHWQKVNEEYRDFAAQQKEIETAFRYWKYYFPEREVPEVFTYFFGYNNRIMAGEKSVGIALDQYLGAGFEGYQGLEEYRRADRIPEALVPELMKGWIMSEFPPAVPASTLAEEMIYQGKVLYLMEKLLPETAPNYLIGFSKTDWTFCEKNEYHIWGFLVEKKLLYDKNGTVIRKYAGEAPNSPAMPEGAPGQAALFTGWKIVSAYMTRFPETSLEDLMKINSAQKILDASRYKPRL